MAGLLKPQAAYELISALKETIDIPEYQSFPSALR
jgi:pyruvate carboxylase